MILNAGPEKKSIKITCYLVKSLEQLNLTSYVCVFNTAVCIACLDLGDFSDPVAYAGYLGKHDDGSVEAGVGIVLRPGDDADNPAGVINYTATAVTLKSQEYL